MSDDDDNDEFSTLYLVGNTEYERNTGSCFCCMVDR